MEETELARRRAEWRPSATPYPRGYGRLFVEPVLQTDQGCDFDFLRAVKPAAGATRR